MNGTFYDQLGGVAGIFEGWGTCERTVVVCALARKVPWPGLKLVQRAVEAALKQHGEDERLERDANDETLLENLLASRGTADDDEGAGERLRQLLTLLPLLRADNERGKDAYVAAAPALVQRCVGAPRRAAPAAAAAAAAAPELCRQLLSYLLVHPALTPADQRILTQWLRYLENHISGNRNTESVWHQKMEPCLLTENIWSSNNTFRRTIGKNIEFRSIVDLPELPSYCDILQESFSKNGRDVDLSTEGDKLNFDATISQPKSQRSNSLTPPSSNFTQMSSSAENLSDEPFVQKPRSFSLSSEHSLSQIRPISVMYGTTGSETRLDDLKSNNFTEHPGMSTVAAWLKSLRLHKYVWLFTNISYEQMMAMDEEYLEKLGVTKGARHKLLLSIRRLGERPAALAAARAELAAAGAGGAGAGAGAGAAGRALERVRAALLAPMAPASRVPHDVVRLLEMASKTISEQQQNGGCGGCGGAPPEDADGAVDPLSLHCWLVEKALQHELFRREPELVEALRRLRHRLPPAAFYRHLTDLPHLRRHKHSRWRAGAPPAHGGFTRAAPPARRPWAPPPRGKSHSYPPFPPAAPLPLRPPRPPREPHSPHSPHDYSSLDALCLQMTEQAIN